MRETGKNSERPVPARDVVGAVTAGTAAVAGTFVEHLFGLGPGAFTAGVAAVAPVVIRAFVASASRRQTPGKRRRSDLTIVTAGVAAVERLQIGESPSEALFTPDEIGWTPADELADAAMRAAARDNERRKAPYLGRLWAALAFESEFSVETAFQFMTMADELSYTQLQLLALYSDRHGYQLASARPTQMTWNTWQLYQAFDDLGYGKRGLLRPEPAPPGQLPTRLNVPDGMEIGDVGEKLVQLMELNRIPGEELRAVAAGLADSP